MSISKEQVDHIAHLARLQLDEEEPETFQQELESILDYVDQLQDAGVEGVEPLRTISGAHNALRGDEPSEDPERRPEGQDLIDKDPETRDGFVRTKGVFDDTRTS